VIIEKLFPTTVQEREDASSAPVRFFLRDFVRVAVTMALILAAFYVFIPSTRSSTLGQRLYTIISLAVFMAGFRVWAARKSSR
jgi:hypothetical protein